ncbi:glycosyltransferase family 4 protein [Proteiniphilum sp.]|nr:glycosyltransferase family 4 protein [Proteiniphilum sp.]MEA4918561.1 glycosyltransferase family 4 protein [Proteiniphilum sp.]
MRKIALISPQLYPFYIGGVEVFNYYLLKELSKECSLEYVSYDKLEDNNTLKHFRLIRSKYLKYFHFIFLITILSIKRRVFILSFSRSNIFYWAIFPILNILLNTRYVIIIHGGGLTGLKKGVIYNNLFKRSMKLFGVSQVICEEYSRVYKLQIEYLPPVIPFKQSNLSKENLRLNYSIQNFSQVFLYVGSLKKLKRPEIIIEAFNYLGDKYLEKENVIMIIAGNGPMYQDLVDRVNQYKLCKYIKLIGNVERNNVPDLYKIADHYIISSDYEGTPISMLEAMYNKVTILASNSQGINDIIINNWNGVLFDNNNVEELSKLLKQIISNPDFAKTLSKNAHSTYIDNYSFKDTINKIKTAIFL